MKDGTFGDSIRERKGFTDLSRLRGALDQIYDDCAGKSEMNCDSLSQLILRATGILLTEDEAGRLMTSMTSNNSTISNSSNSMVTRDFDGSMKMSSKILSREEFHNFFEYGVQTHLASQKRAAKAAILLQDFLRHVAIAQMSVLRKTYSKRLGNGNTQVSTNITNVNQNNKYGDNNSNNDGSDPANSNKKTLTLKSIKEDDHLILLEGAKAAWRSMDPQGAAAVPIDHRRHTLHLRNCHQAAASWKGDTYHTLSHDEYAYLSEIVHPGSEDSKFSFEAMCRFASIGPESTRPICSVIVTRTKKDAINAYNSGYWRGNYFAQNLDSKCSVQFWY